MSVISDTITGDFLQNKQGRAGVGEEEGESGYRNKSTYGSSVGEVPHQLHGIACEYTVRPEPQTQTDGRSTELEAQK